MALKEQDVVLTTKDESGNTVIQMPITRKENVEGLSEELEKHPLFDGNEAIPTGFVLPFAANSSPDGFLLCNGAEVSRATYANLFAEIGTLYGDGDGASTFNLPDLNTRFIQGSGTAGTSKSAGLPNITGNSTRFDANTGWDDNMLVEGAFYLETNTNKGKLTSDGSSSSETWATFAFDASRSNPIYGASTTVQPPALTMRYYIKY